MTTRARDRLAYVSLAVATIAIGLLVHLRGTLLNTDMRDVLGDALWAAMMFWWVSAVVPTASPVRRGSGALAICFTVELSQLIDVPALDALRGTLFGRLVLGSGFDVRDLAAYLAGVMAAAGLEYLVRRHRLGFR
jgi:hypothetical protein